MTRFLSITPNLIVKDLAKSLVFYRDVLGFKVQMSVPDAEPFVFVGLEHDGVPVFLNSIGSVLEDHPEMSSTPFGGTGTMFFVITGVDALHDEVKGKTAIVMPLKTQFYGMREFSVKDPDGHLITFAERVGEQ